MNYARFEKIILTWALAICGAASPGADGFDRWTAIEPRPSPQGLGQVAYGDGQWLALSDDGLLSSTNGITWSGTSFSRDFTIATLAYANGLWVAGARQFTRPICDGSGYYYIDALLTSPDGVNWTHLPEATEPLYELGADAVFVDTAFASGRWIVVGSAYARYVTSLDGRTWTAHGLGQLTGSAQVLAVANGNGTWVLAGRESVRYINASGQELYVNLVLLFTSPDGLNWTRRTVGEGTFSDVGYGNGQWVAVGRSNIWSSVDAINWEVRLQGGSFDRILSSVAYANGRWVVAGYHYANNSGILLGSANATNWSVLRQDNGAAYADVAFGSNQWLVTGSSLLSSSNGTVFTVHPSGQNISTKLVNGLTYGSNRWVAVGESFDGAPTPLIATSTNGQSWTSVPLALPDTSIGSLAYGEGRWLALGTRSPNNSPAPITLTSTNGTSWSSLPSTLYSSRSPVAFGNGIWLCAPGDDNIYTATSPGFSWVPRLLPPAMQFSYMGDIAFADGLWVMAGAPYAGQSNQSPWLAISLDGTNWTHRPLSNANMRVSSLAHGGGQWVAVGEESVILSNADCPYRRSTVALVLTSPDGVNWTRRDTGLEDGSGLGAVTWTGEEFVAGGFYNRMAQRSIVLTSSNGIAWQARISTLGRNVDYIAFGNGRVVAAGNYGGGLTISDFISPAPPTLTVLRSGPNVVVSWPSSKTGFTLQSTTNLATSVLWSDVTNTPVTVGDNFIITNTISAGSRVFRLKGF